MGTAREQNAQNSDTRPNSRKWSGVRACAVPVLSTFTFEVGAEDSGICSHALSPNTHIQTTKRILT